MVLGTETDVGRLTISSEHVAKNAMNRAGDLRNALASGRLVKAAGAHNGLGARLAERSGFDALWASSLEISASYAVPDAGLLGMTELLEAARMMHEATSIPVIADCDTGFGGELNIAYMVHRYETAGIAAVSIEDQANPKRNSLDNSDRQLIDAHEFAYKIEVAKASQKTDSFMVIARTEALIVGASVRDALNRASRYADAGADGILLHSRAPTASQVLEFMAQWERPTSVIVVPTTYYGTTALDLEKARINMVIYANHGLRAAMQAMEKTYRCIIEAGGTSGLEDSIARIDDVFDLQRRSSWLQPST
jgi:phosphoenolpyruvate phosphomutase